MASSKADSIVSLCRVEVENRVGGYRKDLLIENLSERDELFLVCSRCSGLLKEACTVGSGEQVCVDCIKHDEQSLPNIQVRNTVIKLKCRCPLSQNGCEWSDELRHCEEHLETCQLMLVKCQLGCEVVVTRAEEKSHLNETCVLRTVKCEHCGIVCVVGEINEHSGVCPQVVVECDLGCGEQVKREHLGKHSTSECEEGIVPCPFEKYGCDFGEVTRREMKSHLQERKESHTEMRLDSMEDQIKNQHSLIEYLTKKVIALENHNQLMEVKLEKKGVINWEIENMVANLNFETIIMKVPSSRVLDVCGYKIRFGWWIEGTMFFIDMYTVRGDKDGDLEWPFRATCISRFIRFCDPGNSLVVRNSGMELKRKYSNILNNPGCRIASVDKYQILEPGFLNKGVLKLEIIIKSLN